MQLKNKNILLTGASSGLGYCLAEKLIEEKSIVYLLGRSKEKHEKLLRFPNTQFYQVDLSNPSDVKNQIKDISEVDIIINCAGMSITGKIEDIPIEEFERALKVNFESPVAIIQHFLPLMKKRKSGMIVNVSSGVAIRALPFTAPYSSAKAALNSFSDALRIEIKNDNIHVLHFAPGPVDSKFHENIKHYGTTRLSSPKFTGVKAETVASRLLKAIKNEEERVTLGHKARLAKHFQYWSPKLFDRILLKNYKI